MRITLGGLFWLWSAPVVNAQPQGSTGLDKGSLASWQYARRSVPDITRTYEDCRRLTVTGQQVGKLQMFSNTQIDCVDGESAGLEQRWASPAASKRASSRNGVAARRNRHGDPMSKPNQASSNKPVVGVIADLKMLGHHPFHCAGNKYVVAAVDGADTFAILLPAMAGQQSIEQTLDLVDGLMFTGSPSNVEPRHYGGPSSAQGTLHDPARDATSLPLIRAAIAAGVPVFGICRGFQEINVALGGTLHQKVHEVPGMLLHREREEDPLEIQYGPAHQIAVVPGGKLESWYGKPEATVNSLHNQGVETLAPGARVEAVAPDGLVEAFSVKDASSFAFAVQWHPEWQFADNPLSVALFAAFGAACRDQQARKQGGQTRG